MPVIPPNRSNPYVPPEQIEREELPGEPMEKTGKGERTMLIVVVVMLFLCVLAGLVLPHTPFAGD
jgi:hypothetical protein